MQRRLSAMAFCLLLAALVAGSTATASAQTTTAIVTGTERVFVRRGPGNEFPPFASIPSGSTVEVQETRGEWSRITTASGQVGYINSNFLSVPGEAERRSPTVRATFTRTSARPTWTRLVLTPTPAVPSNTPAPTRTRPPSATHTETRTPIPSKTPTDTRTPSVTRTPRLTSTPITPSPKPTITATPTSSTTPTSKEPPPVRTAMQRTHEMENEIAALKQELADLKSRRPAAIDAVGAPAPDGCSDQVRTELARLAVAVESLQHRLNSTPVPVREAELPTPPAAPNDTHVFPPVAVFLGVVGIMFGGWLGSTYARKQERSRRSRLRF